MPDADPDTHPDDRLDDDLALALELADLADATTLPHYRRADLAVSTKPDLTEVTEADQAAERVLRERLATRRPGDAILGEEYGSAGLDGASRLWVIDPIDGTRNFVRGVPAWCTLVALVIDGRPAVGVASAPALARRWWAATGRGAWTLGPESADPRRLAVSAVAAIADASLSVSDHKNWPGDSYARLQHTVWRSRAYGDFWSHMLVAEGAVDIAAEPQLSPWDIAALIPVIEEAGGRATAYDGSPIDVTRPGTGSLLATNGRLHDAVIALIAADGPPAAGRSPGGS